LSGLRTPRTPRLSSRPCRKGLGRALLQAVVAQAKEEGCCKVTLECLHDNTLARSLYDSLGFASNMAFMELKLDSTKYH